MKTYQKPTEIDAHLKYRCPKCDNIHWISLRQAKTKHYKIVCECGYVFEPKRIKKLKVSFYDPKVKTDTTNQKETNIQINKELLSECIGVLTNYGFTKAEADKLIHEAYVINQTDNCVELLKSIFKSIGVNSVL